MSRPDTQAFQELLDLLREAEHNFLHERNQTADEDIADNYKHLLDLLSMGIDFYVYNDWERPRVVPIVTPQRKIGGDNAHALYHFAPLLGEGSYLLRGNRGQAAYLGFTVYGGEDESAVHISANTNSSELVFEENGDFEIVLSMRESDNRAANHIRIAPDSNSLFIRQYFLNQRKEGPARLEIEALDLAPPAPVLTGERMARKLRSLTNVIRGWTQLAPMPWPEDEAAYNQVCPPFHTGASTGHWSTPDNLHAFGFFKIRDDQALVLRGRSPECLYWSCHLWNACMQTFDYEHHASAICQQDVVLEADGSWRLVVARTDPGVPNWLDTTGYAKGFIYFRWLLSAEVPGPIDCAVISLAELGRWEEVT